MVRTLAQLVARRRADRVDAVGDPADAGGPAVVVVGVAVVAVPAGLAERLAAEVDPRTPDQALRLRPRDAVVGAAEVAHGGEAAVEHRAHVLRGAERQVRRATRCAARDRSALAATTCAWQSTSPGRTNAPRRSRVRTSAPPSPLPVSTTSPSAIRRSVSS